MHAAARPRCAMAATCWMLMMVGEALLPCAKCGKYEVSTDRRCIRGYTQCAACVTSVKTQKMARP